VPGRLPTVDVQDLAGDEGGPLEIQDAVDDVADLADPAEGVECRQALVRRGVVYGGLSSTSYALTIDNSGTITASHAIITIAGSYPPTDPKLVLNNTGGSVQGQTIDSNTFGQIRSSLDPRIMQFALKYVF